MRVLDQTHATRNVTLDPAVADEVETATVRALISGGALSGAGSSGVMAASEIAVMVTRAAQPIATTLKLFILKHSKTCRPP